MDFEVKTEGTWQQSNPNTSFEGKKQKDFSAQYTYSGDTTPNANTPPVVHICTETKRFILNRMREEPVPLEHILEPILDEERNHLIDLSEGQKDSIDASLCGSIMEQFGKTFQHRKLRSQNRRSIELKNAQTQTMPVVSTN